MRKSLIHMTLQNLIKPGSLFELSFEVETFLLNFTSSKHLIENHKNSFMIPCIQQQQEFRFMDAGNPSLPKYI